MGNRGIALSIEFKVSRDTHLLDQYYALREKCFRLDLGLANFDGSEEELDRQGAVLLALDNGRCVGGARISSHISLPSQADLLEVDRSACCMWERFAIDPAVRSVHMVREFVAHLIKASRDGGFRTAMVLSSLRNARFYRRCHTAIGVEYHILRHVPHCAQGAFAGMEHYLSVAHLEDSQPLSIAV